MKTTIPEIEKYKINHPMYGRSSKDSPEGCFRIPYELVIQFHPPEKDYINICKTALHMWRPLKQFIQLPPKLYV